MKTIRHLLIAATVMVFANVASAQTADASVAVTATPNAPYSADPFIQKRHADKLAKDEYKAKKKAAKAKMKAEKKEAKSEMKFEKAVASEERKEALAADPIKVDPAK